MLDARRVDHRWVVPLLLLLAACSHGSSGNAVGLSVLSGTVAMGGPVKGASVSAYDVDPATRRLVPIARGTTDTVGSYSLNLTLGARPVLVVATGGTYVDDATGTTATLASASPTSIDDVPALALQAVIGAGQRRSRLHITPLTTIAARRVAALARIQADALDEPTVREANLGVSVGMHVAGAESPVDPRSEAPLDYTSAADAATIKKAPLSPAARYGAVLSGISKSAQMQGLANPTLLVEALARDFEDGTFDGQTSAPGATTGAPVPLGGGTLSSSAATDDLAAAMRAFLDDPTRNASGTSSSAVGPQ